MMMKLSRSLLFLSITWWIDQSNSPCSIQIITRMQGGIAITFECGGQCTFQSTYQSHQCVNLVNELGVQCNQTDCTPRNYNFSACITGENGVIINSTQTTNCQCSNDREATINGMPTTGQPQTCTTTTVYQRTDRTEAPSISYTTKPLFSSEVQVVIGALVGLLMVLVVMTIIPWIWICWRLKTKQGLKRDKQQARNTHNSSTTILKMDENPAYVTKTHLQRNLASENTSEPMYEIIPTVTSQIANISMQRSDREGGSDQMNTID